MAPKGKEDWLDAYLADSRDLAMSFLLIAPILLGYEIGIFITRSRFQNAIEYVVKAPFHQVLGGLNTFLLFNGLVLLISGFLAARMLDRNRLRGEVVVGVALEGLLYAIVLGAGVGSLVRGVGLSIGGGDPVLGVVLSLGAGVYEEVFFRLGLLEALFHVLVRWLRFSATDGGVISVILGSLIFSGAHYIGVTPSASFDANGFLFRFVAGVVLATIYVTRGLAVAVYTHAFYDCLLALQAS